MDLPATCRTMLARWRGILYRNRKRFLGWESIAAFAGSWIVRTSFFWIAVVPLVAQLFSRLEKTVTFSTLGHSWSLHLVLPFSWKAFFFASLLAAVATWICNTFCPDLILKYSSFRAFRDAGKGGDQIRRTLEHSKSSGMLPDEWEYFSDCLIRINIVTQNPEKGTGFSTHLGQNGALKKHVANGVEATDGLYEAALSEAFGMLSHFNNDSPHMERMFWAARSATDATMPFARMIATACAGIATSLYFWILLQNVWFVIRFVTK